jgi:signal peptidase I
VAKLLRSLAWLAGILGAIALVLRVLFFKAWTVPDDPLLAASIAPTLWPGDVVLVLTSGEPGFGDLVRCADPENPMRFVVGRIAGVAGDVVEVEGSALTVNGDAYRGINSCPEPKFLVAHPTTGADVELRCDTVEMGGRVHLRGTMQGSPYARKGNLEVGEGSVYLVSDDRAFPYDSRIFGLLPLDSCKEQIVFRLVSAEGWADADRRLSYIR